MTPLSDVTRFLEQHFPVALAEQWDNVGLLLGDRSRPVKAVMTCLTLSPDVAAEAVEQQAQLIVSHHPILFRPIQKITRDTPEGSVLLNLCSAGIAVYSPHTAYDSADAGINQQLAETIGLTNIAVLRPVVDHQNVQADSKSIAGAGRYGDLENARTLAELLPQLKGRLDVDTLSYAGDSSIEVRRLGIACGAAAEFMNDARQADCQALLTGEARFHAYVEARSLGMALIIAGHYATERPAVEKLAQTLSDNFPALNVWASHQETDPVRYL